MQPERGLSAGAALNQAVDLLRNAGHSQAAEEITRHFGVQRRTAEKAAHATDDDYSLTSSLESCALSAGAYNSRSRFTSPSTPTYGHEQWDGNVPGSASRRMEAPRSEDVGFVRVPVADSAQFEALELHRVAEPSRWSRNRGPNRTSAIVSRPSSYFDQVTSSMRMGQPSGSSAVSSTSRSHMQQNSQDGNQGNFGVGGVRSGTMHDSQSRCSDASVFADWQDPPDATEDAAVFMHYLSHGAWHMFSNNVAQEAQSKSGSSFQASTLEPFCRNESAPRLNPISGSPSPRTTAFTDNSGSHSPHSAWNARGAFASTHTANDLQSASHIDGDDPSVAAEAARSAPGHKTGTFSFSSAFEEPAAPPSERPRTVWGDAGQGQGRPSRADPSSSRAPQLAWNRVATTGTNSASFNGSAHSDAAVSSGHESAEKARKSGGHEERNPSLPDLFEGALQQQAPAAGEASSSRAGNIVSARLQHILGPGRPSRDPRRTTDSSAASKTATACELPASNDSHNSVMLDSVVSLAGNVRDVVVSVSSNAAATVPSQMTPEITLNRSPRSSRAESSSSAANDALTRGATDARDDSVDRARLIDHDREREQRVSVRSASDALSTLERMGSDACRPDRNLDSVSSLGHVTMLRVRTGPSTDDDKTQQVFGSTVLLTNSPTNYDSHSNSQPGDDSRGAQPVLRASWGSLGRELPVREPRMRTGLQSCEEELIEPTRDPVGPGDAGSIGAARSILPAVASTTIDRQPQQQQQLDGISGGVDAFPGHLAGAPRPWTLALAPGPGLGSGTGLAQQSSPTESYKTSMPTTLSTPQPVPMPGSDRSDARVPSRATEGSITFDTGPCPSTGPGVASSAQDSGLQHQPLTVALRSVSVGSPTGPVPQRSLSVGSPLVPPLLPPLPIAPAAHSSETAVGAGLTCAWMPGAADIATASHSGGVVNVGVVHDAHRERRSGGVPSPQREVQTDSFQQDVPVSSRAAPQEVQESVSAASSGTEGSVPDAVDSLSAGSPWTCPDSALHAESSWSPTQDERRWDGLLRDSKAASERSTAVFGLSHDSTVSPSQGRHSTGATFDFSRGNSSTRQGSLPMPLFQISSEHHDTAVADLGLPQRNSSHPRPRPLEPHFTSVSSSGVLMEALHSGGSLRYDDGRTSSSSHGGFQSPSTPATPPKGRDLSASCPSPAASIWNLCGQSSVAQQHAAARAHHKMGPPPESPLSSLVASPTASGTSVPLLDLDCNVGDSSPFQSETSHSCGDGKATAYGFDASRGESTGFLRIDDDIMDLPVTVPAPLSGSISGSTDAGSSAAIRQQQQQLGNTASGGASVYAAGPSLDGGPFAAARTSAFTSPTPSASHSAHGPAAVGVDTPRGGSAAASPRPSVAESGPPQSPAQQRTSDVPLLLDPVEPLSATAAASRPSGGLWPPLPGPLGPHPPDPPSSPPPEPLVNVATAPARVGPTPSDTLLSSANALSPQPFSVPMDMLAMDAPQRRLSADACAATWWTRHVPHPSTTGSIAVHADSPAPSSTTSVAAMSRGGEVPTALPMLPPPTECLTLRIYQRPQHTGLEPKKEFAIAAGDVLADRYEVHHHLGAATFSRAVAARDRHTDTLVCLKVIRSNKDYLDQSLDEIKLLRFVNDADPANDKGIVRLLDFFYWREHLVLVTELLHTNLYQCRKTADAGDARFPSHRLQSIARQVLTALAFLHSLNLIHCDLKPENLMFAGPNDDRVKVIDLGSSCFVWDRLASYVQSRAYRAPEVVLGARYDHKIDVWGLGCILAELATNSILFQNKSVVTMLARIESTCGPLPPALLQAGRHSHLYYTRSGTLYERNRATGTIDTLRPLRSSLSAALFGAPAAADPQFIDFLELLLQTDPALRPTAAEALTHPYVQASSAAPLAPPLPLALPMAVPMTEPLSVAAAPQRGADDDRASQRSDATLSAASTWLEHSVSTISDARRASTATADIPPSSTSATHAVSGTPGSASNLLATSGSAGAAGQTAPGPSAWQSVDAEPEAGMKTARSSLEQTSSASFMM